MPARHIFVADDAPQGIAPEAPVRSCGPTVTAELPDLPTGTTVVSAIRNGSQRRTWVEVLKVPKPPVLLYEPLALTTKDLVGLFRTFSFLGPANGAVFRIAASRC